MELLDDPANGKVRFRQEPGTTLHFQFQQKLDRRDLKHFFPFTEKRCPGKAVCTRDLVQIDFLMQMLLKPDRNIPNPVSLGLTFLPIGVCITDFPVKLKTDPVDLICHAR